MPVFRPPTQPDSLVGGGGDSHPLWESYGAYEAGTTVWKYKPDQSFTDIERISNIVSVSFASAHGLNVGDIVTVVVPTDSSFNGTFTITDVPSAFLFKYPQAGSDVFVSGGFVAFWTHSAYPYHGGAEYRTYDHDTFTITTDTGLATAQEVYFGGSEHLITEDKRTELIAAGFGSSVSYDSYLKINNVNSYFSTPNHADFDAIVNLDVRILAESPFDHWIPVFLSNHLISHGNSAKWVVSIHPTGLPRTQVYTDGGPGPEGKEPLGFKKNSPHWFRSTVKDTGQNQAIVAYLTSPDGSDGSWTELGDPITVPATSPVFTPVAQALYIPGSSGALAWLSKIFYAELRSDIDGAIVANPDFRNLAPGTTSFTDSKGKVWTRTGTDVEIVGV